MVRTSLRDYTREIEDLIENGQNEEAVEHCRHILQEYPKNLAAKRLLGKAYLELGQDQEAAAAFQQVLDAVPDDFIAHLGLSVIREHEGDMDASIRHMERTFDVQPANAVIQGELRRLYKQRDGLEPQKIHLTRGALARMYAKGDLYSQAIAELRSALGEDPHRHDLQIVLAKMYAKSGQLLEAVEACNSLLGKLPDCLEAHVILGDILSRTERSAEAQAHYQRAAALDPYAAHISPGQPDLESVPDESVMLDRLEYLATAGPAVPLAEGEWEKQATTSPANEESPMELVEEVELMEEGIEPEEIPEEHQAEKTPGEQIPDWMQTAGWEPASGVEEEPALESGGEIDEFAEEEDELVKAEIPDWLKPLAPSEVEETAFLEAEGVEGTGASPPWSGESVTSDLEAAGTSQGTGSEEELPDWLRAAEEAQPEQEQETTDWMKTGEGEELEPEGAIPGWQEPVESAQPEPEPETPDWLIRAEAEQLEPEDELPDWMKVEGTEPEEPGSEMPDWSASEKEEVSEVAEELPEWLKSAEGEGTGPGDELPDWMKSEEEEASPPEGEMPAQEVIFGSAGAMVYTYQAESEPDKEGEGADEIAGGAAWAPEGEIPEMEAESGETGEGEAGEPEVPEWLRSLGEESLAEEGEMPAEEVGMPFLPEKEESAQAEALSGASEVPDWLRSTLEEQEQSQAEQPADIPDWLRSSIPEGFPEEPPPIEGDTKPVRPRLVEEQLEEEAGEVTFEEQAPEQVTEYEGAGAWDVPEGALPEMPAEAPAEAEAFAFKEEETILPEEISAAGSGKEEEAAAMGWLESLAAREGAQEEELLTRPEERSESIPDWLQKLATETEVGEAVEEGESVEEIEPEPTEWQPEMESAGEVAGEPEPAVGELQMEPPAWQPEEVAAAEVISEPAEQSEEEEIETGQTTWQAEMETEAEMPAETATTLERDAELPEWLRDFAEEEAGPAGEEEVPAGETISPPAEPVDFNTATLAQLERIPGIGYILAQNIVNYREVHGPIRSREDLEKVPGISPDDVDRLGQWGSFEEMEEISAPVEEPQEVLPEIEPGGQPPVLEQAWGKLVSGEVTTAVDLYGELIRKEQHLDQVIHELREAAFLYPQEISIHQALGDAYLRANRLQEALDAYNKAEDLLK